MAKIHSVVLCVFGLSMAALQPANAGLVTSLPGGTIMGQPVLEYVGSGPQAFGPANLVTWTSTWEHSVFGYTGSYGFLDNGTWIGLPALAGLNNSGAQSMTFAFSTPQAGVGGRLNWVAGDAGLGGNATIAAYDSTNTLIESFTLSTAGVNDTPPDTFYGFLEASPVISYLVLSDGYIALRDLTVTDVTAVPEPGTLSLLGMGLLGLAAARRRKSK